MSFIAEFYVFEKQQLNLYSNKIYSKENTRKNVHTMFRSNMDGLLPVVAGMLLLPSWVFILFVAAAAAAAEPETARCLVLLVASAFWPLALSVGEEALAGAGRGVQLPQQDRVAARQEPMLLLLLLKLVAAVVVVVAAAVVAVAIAAVVAVAVAVEARHGRATVEKSLMKNGLPARFINYPGSAAVGRANFKQSWLTSFQI